MYSCIGIVAFTSNCDIKNLQVSPELPSLVLVDGDSKQTMRVTSLLSRWNALGVRKDSNLQLSDTIFEKHNYLEPIKQKRKKVKDLIQALKNTDIMPNRYLVHVMRISGLGFLAV